MNTYSGDAAITESAPQGALICLTCRHHPDKRWNTKNIGFIGARTIRFEGPGTECSCPTSDLEYIDAEPYSLGAQP